MNDRELWDFSQGGFDQEDKATSTEWKYLIKRRTLYIGFKYTSSKKDWRQNFFFLPRLARPYSKMAVAWFVHAGFRLKWRAIKDRVHKVIEDNLNKIGRIVFVGHSQGGALAILAHEYAGFIFPQCPLETKTFGAPRAVFFWNFRKVKNRFEGIINYRAYMDIVPRLPPKIFGYKDTGKIVILGEKKFHIPFPPKVIARNHECYGELL